MAFVPVPGVIQVDVIYLWSGQRVENTLYFQKGDGWTLPQIIDWVDQLNTLISEELMPLLNNSIQFIELIARLLDTASSIGYSLPISPAVSGGVAGEGMPNNVTYTISLKTGLTGRSFRGRNFVPGLSPDNVNGNTIASGFRTGILAFYNELRALAESTGNPLVVVSRYSGVNPTTGKPIPRVEGIATEVISITTFDDIVDSQRRRLPGRGS
jgi:hypothetical protein